MTITINDALAAIYGSEWFRNENILNTKNLPTEVITMENSQGLIFKGITEEMLETFIKKNADYGNSFDKSLDEDGLLVSKIRLGDKYSRFATLIKKPQEVADESLEDTLLDMANYAIMTVMWMRGQDKQLTMELPDGPDTPVDSNIMDLSKTGHDCYVDMSPGLLEIWDVVRIKRPYSGKYIFEYRIHQFIDEKGYLLDGVPGVWHRDQLIFVGRPKQVVE